MGVQIFSGGIIITILMTIGIIRGRREASLKWKVHVGWW